MRLPLSQIASDVYPSVHQPTSPANLDMRCSICEQDHAAVRHELLCVACARLKLHEPRLKLAGALLEKETLGKQITPILGGDPARNSGKKSGNDGTDSWGFEFMQARTRRALERIADHQAETQAIVKDNESARRRVVVLKHELNKRKEQQLRMKRFLDERDKSLNNQQH